MELSRSSDRQRRTKEKEQERSLRMQRRLQVGYDEDKDPDIDLGWYQGIQARKEMLERQAEGWVLNPPSFLSAYNKNLHRYEIASNSYDLMSQRQRMFWRIKSRNMKAHVFLSSHKSYMLFFSDREELNLFWNIIKVSEEASKSVEVSMPKQLKEDFKGFIPLCLSKADIKLFTTLLYREYIPSLLVSQEKDPTHNLKKTSSQELFIQEVITASIHPGQIWEDRYSIAVAIFYTSFAMIFFNASTNQFYIQEGNTDPEGKNMRNILSQYRPLEILVQNTHQKEDILKIYEGSKKPFIASFKLPFEKEKETQDYLKKIALETKSKYLEQIYDYFKEGVHKTRITAKSKALKLFDLYLDGLGLKSTFFDQGVFIPWNPSRSAQFTFHPSTSKERRKVQENCLTSQGKRMISNYFDDCLPVSKDQVMQAIQEITKNRMTSISSGLLSFEKFNQNLGVLYHLNTKGIKEGKCIKINLLLTRIKGQKITFRDKFGELIKVKDLLIECQKFLEQPCIKEAKSQIFKKYVQLRPYQGIIDLFERQSDNFEGVPMIQDILRDIFRDIKDNQPVSLNSCQPQLRINNIKKKIESIKESLKDVFQTQQVTLNGAKHNIQVPKNKKDKGNGKPQLKYVHDIKDKKGEYSIFQCLQIKKQYDKEVNQKKEIQKLWGKQFIKILQVFCDKRIIFNKYVQAIAWIDGLVALANEKEHRSIMYLEKDRFSHKQSVSGRELIPQEEWKDISENHEEQGLVPQKGQDRMDCLLDDIVFDEVELFLKQFTPEIQVTEDEQLKLSTISEEYDKMYCKLKEADLQLTKEREEALYLRSQLQNLQKEYSISLSFENTNIEEIGYDKNDLLHDSFTKSKRSKKYLSYYPLRNQPVSSEEIANQFMKIGPLIINNLQDNNNKKAKEAFHSLEIKLKERVRLEMRSPFNKRKMQKQNSISQQSGQKIRIFNELRKILHLLEETYDSKLNIFQEQFKVECEQRCLLIKQAILLKESQLKTFQRINADMIKQYRQTSFEIQKEKGNVRVFCRIRPRKIQTSSIAVSSRQNLSLIRQKKNVATQKLSQYGTPFCFNRIFKENDGQQVVFEEVQTLVDNSVIGNKVCIFCYGQTGTGKTFTMIGGEDELNRGIVPRSVARIFKKIEEKMTKGVFMQVSFHASQIYNNALIPLLKEELILNSEEHAMSQISNALTRRITASTNQNQTSSRSHLIFKFSYSIAKENVGQICFIDLAGSESFKGGDAKLKKESSEINSSLLALKLFLQQLKSKKPSRKTTVLDNGMVTPNKPNQQSKQKPVAPTSSFNSALVKTLKPILIGNCISLMFINVSPDKDDLESTRLSLEFGQEAQGIVTKLK